MFLLFVDRRIAPGARARALRLRECLKGAFDDIGDIDLVDDADQLEKRAEFTLGEESALIVPFGIESAKAVGTAAPILPVVMPKDADDAAALSNAIAVLSVGDLGDLAIGRARPIGWPLSLDEPVSQFHETPPADKTHAKLRRLTWPLWNAPAVAAFRGIDSDVEKTLSIPGKDLLFDSRGAHADETLRINGVIFASAMDVSDISGRLSPFLTTFLEAFRHNDGATLHISLTGDPANIDKKDALRPQLISIIEPLDRFACRIVFSDAADRPENPSVSLAPATFYITADDLSDIYWATAHMAAQMPVITPAQYTSAFRLSPRYPLAASTEKPVAEVLKNAFHIAKTAPEGYRQLRRYAIDNSREIFSLAHGVEQIRTVLNEPNVKEIAPNIDARRDRENLMILGIGLFDHTQSGWIDYETQSVAPGFRIEKTDRVVDVGCGNGGFSRFVSVLAGEVIYCDLDEHSLAAAGDHIRQVAQCPIRGVLTTGENLDIESEYADKVICTEVLEHVDDPKQVMEELVRIGKPGSLYLISVPDTLNEILQTPLAPPQYFQKPNHIRIFERDEFHDLVAASGLEIINHQFRGFYAVFEWLLKWFNDPELELKWAKLWKHLLDHEKGPATKHTLDQHIAKSQSIIARKPAA
ncbi:MAG: class I SAM-dependent methyltransferase [Pseudomonadota bacterium]